eukprot:gnl/Trimastix_PCT/2491.p1 GENE.gnl/Trimastix_PCT/2491~~gnl/Trimastix_PCT/2491.p1  ORF type:complete len:500 (-),score=71.75 gnl/Trimastix_PCT/2491:10-1509(-)
MFAGRRGPWVREFPPHFLVICNPENRRLTFFQDACRDFGLPDPPLTVVSYEDVLRGRIHWASLIRTICEFPHFRSGHLIVRYESPGENFEVEKRLVYEGAEATLKERHDSIENPPSFVSSERALGLSMDRGLILCPRQWFLGYERLLMKIHNDIVQAVKLFKAGHALLMPLSDSSVPLPPHAEPTDSATDDANPVHPLYPFTSLRLHFMNDPAEVALMFDKCACSEHLRARGVPVPRSIMGIRSYDQLREALTREPDFHKCFIKIAHGSSASGVIAYQYAPELAITTAEIEHDRRNGSVRLYNSLRIRHYARKRDLTVLINRLCAEKVIVEQWLPKARQNGDPYDLRILVVAGEPRQFVVRLGRTCPMTNLHLGNARGDSEQLLRDVPPEQWAAIQETCRRVARCFPHTCYMGVDLLLNEAMSEHWVLEVNAYGDLLPRITHDGLSTYHSEILAGLDLMERIGRLPTTPTSASSAKASEAGTLPEPRRHHTTRWVDLPE